jgi:cytochrome c biogenesis protein CcdA
MAVLLMVLVSILTADPKNKKKVLYSGLAFSFAIFLTYILYGTIIIEFFTRFTDVTRASSVVIYRILAVLAMVIGALQIKDYFFYTPGGFATEMPKFMRPYAKLAISKITSVWGAFFVGIFVTLFLLPCTMGPYFVASILLAEKGVLASIPMLVYYNLIFILPMILITLIVYFGYSKVEKISGWKERNIKLLHLIAGILIFGIGISILLGWI